MKLIGKVTDSLIIKLTFFLFVLFCIPTINSKNKEKLNVKANNNFFKGTKIYLSWLSLIVIQFIDIVF